MTEDNVSSVTAVPKARLRILHDGEGFTKQPIMSKAQLTQLLISLIGIALAVVVFLFAPFGMVVNGIIAFVIFVIAGAAASFAYARLANSRNRAGHPPA